MAVGRDVGCKDGWLLVPMVGTADGRGEGSVTRVGCDEGGVVGLEDGWELGRRVGSEVGKAAGPIVGSEVG